jgi:CRISPR-associated protein Csm2
MNNPHVKFKNKGGGNSMGKNKNQQGKNQQGRKQGQNQNPPIQPVLSNEDINKILKLEENNDNTCIKILLEKAVELAEKFKQIPSSKLRDFYDYVVQIDESLDGNNENNENWYIRLMLLKPKMTYQASKESDGKKQLALELLESEFGKMLDKIDNDVSKFKNFKTFFEAVVAYHKKYAKN